MKRRLWQALILGLLLLPGTTLTGCGGSTTSKRACVDMGTLIDAQGMDSSQSFSYDGKNLIGGYDVAILWIELTDANTSITQFDTDCTASWDGNTTDYTIQEDQVASGTSTQVDAGAWEKANPGTANWATRVNISSFPDFECTFSVGAGTGASADLLTVKGRLCVE